MLNRTLLGLAIAAALPLAAQAHDAPASITADQQIVVRDADTGKLRAATAEEAASLSAARSKSAHSVLRSNAVTPQVKYHANGATGVRVTDEMMSYSVVTRTADGKLIEQCFANKDLAEAAIKNGTVAASSTLPTE